MARTFQSFLQRFSEPDFSRLEDSLFWREQLPSLALSEHASAHPQSQSPSDDDHDAVLLREEGYVTRTGVLDASDALASVHAVMKAGWPPVFAWLFDPLWQLIGQARFTTWVASLMGPGWTLLPRVWVHHVPITAGSAGWSPHIDYAPDVQSMTDGSPDRLTLWGALTDATVDNGCVHVIPANALPDITRDFHSKKQVTMDDAIAMLHHGRALPLPLGGVIAWNWRVVHWGGIATGRAQGPRLSISLEARHRDAGRTRGEGNPILPATLPSFGERVTVVVRSLATFADEVREPASSVFREWARTRLSSLE